MKIDIPSTSIQMDEVEDLTLFADESFDTSDMNLFEFTEEQDSPLTHLKTIILSLDWEINDDILQDLNDEVDHLQQVWKEDKVALVYLQGLTKVGRYLQEKGAYAHPNAIKLLLIFFYNFEKIISSHDILGDSITALLKADVRKFKILQYQIEQRTKQSTDLSGREIDQGEDEAIISLKKAVLELEWEITDSTLKQLSIRLINVQPEFQSDEYALIIIQGLQVLVRYLDDERADAHPGAVELIHSFSDGLELLSQKNISTEEREDILISRVNNLHNLKISLAASTQQKEPDNNSIDNDNISLPMGTEKNIKPASRDELLEPQGNQPVADEIIDKFIDENSTITATSHETLSDLENENKFSTLEEEIELLFTSDDKDLTDQQYQNEHKEKNNDLPPPEADDILDVFFKEDGEGIEVLDSSAITPILSDADEMIGFYKEKSGEKAILTSSDTMEISPALSDADEMSGFSEEKIGAEISNESLPKLDDQLYTFFEEDEQETEKSEQKTKTQTIEKDIFTDPESMETAPALSDTDEISSFNEEKSGAKISNESLMEIDDRLDAFFGENEQETEKSEQKTKTQTIEKDIFTDPESMETAPALSDTDEISSFNEEKSGAKISNESLMEIDDRLDAFFGENEQETEKSEQKTKTQTIEKDIFTDPESMETAPALSDTDEISSFNEEKSGAKISNESLMEIDDKLDAFFEEDRTKEVPEKDETVIEPDLSTNLSRLFITSSPEIIKQNRKTVKDLLDSSAHNPETTALLHFIDSTLALLPKETEKISEDTVELLDFLQHNINQQIDDPELIAVVIARFTSWHKNLIEETFHPKIPTLEKSTENTELHQEIKELKKIMLEEIGTLREEIQKR